LPLLFAEGESWRSLGLKGDERVSIEGLAALKPIQTIEAEIVSADGDKRAVRLKAAIDTADELDYFRNGGILPYVLRSLARRAP
jgi:aconitate hydratase